MWKREAQDGASSYGETLRLPLKPFQLQAEKAVYDFKEP